MAETILIVDDDPTQRRLLEAAIERMGHKIAQAGSGEEALKILKDPSADIDLMMLDLVMPEMDGFAVLEAMKDVEPQIPVIVLTAQGGIETVVSAMRSGAVDFFVKPASPERMKVGIENALKITALRGEIRRLKKRNHGEMTFSDLIADSAKMHQVIRLGERAAASTIPILIEGESGVGKELIARAIQGQSDRAGKPFVTVNCGAIPENLVESILFGHEKGSFTGAASKHMGKFQEASGGTLFLDEIGELPLDMQVKLLRALQEGEVDPVGAKQPVKVDIRLISATNKDLLELAQAGAFREDLYYRLNVFPIAVPPLRERVEDVSLLVEHFITRFAVEEDKTIKGVDGEAMKMLLSYGWPGNVRQLENSVFRAVVLADAELLAIYDFPQIAAAMGIEAPAVTGPDQLTSHRPVVANETGAHILPDMGTSSSGNAINVMDTSGNLRKLEEIESEMIRLAIDTYSGHMSEVARRLGIGRSTLYRKVRDMGLDVEKKAS